MMVESVIEQSTVAEPVSSRWLWWKKFRIRLWSWEYWPAYVFNIPVVGIWIWNAIRARHPLFFTMTNPGIETGGLFGESKSSILQRIPDHYTPKSILVKAHFEASETLHLAEETGILFPLIAKPEIGERGWLIKKIESPEELTQYLMAHPIDFILQEYIDLPLELSILCYRMPDDSEAGITSICEKKFLHITGDGSSTVGELILSVDRAVLQLEKLQARFKAQWRDIPAAGEVLTLEEIGNHSRGTMFLDRRDQSDPAIEKGMLAILRAMPDIYYGRFDMRVPSWDALRAGKDLRILEFNGTGSDPAHIYQPGYSLVQAYRDMGRHWRIMRQIATFNRRQGIKPAGIREVLSALIIYFRYKRTN